MVCEIVAAGDGVRQNARAAYDGPAGYFAGDALGEFALRPVDGCGGLDHGYRVRFLDLAYGNRAVRTYSWCYAGLMAAWPDIVITRADSPEVLLAVEVKAAGTDAETAEPQIKDYMVHQSCPLGMIVTPRETIFFRNRYTGYGPEAIQRIGECRTSELIEGMPEKPGLSEPDLIRRVDQWLESLQSGNRRSWPGSVQDAMESYVLPAVVSGVARATGPRWRRTGT